MKRTCFSIAAMLAVCGFGAASHADPVPDSELVERMEETPKALEDVGIDEKLSAQVPLDLKFTDAEGHATQLSDVINGRRPVLLTLNYSDCPMLCNLQLDALVEGMRGIAWTAGEQFDVLTVSINPHEKLERTRQFRDKYLATYDRPAAKEGWHFWTGTQDNIGRLARTVGFKYKFVEEQQEYAHTAAAILLSPEGQVTRYLYGVVYQPRDLKLALVEAAEGKVGSTVDRILLYCFHYDAAAGKYSPVAANIMRLGGAVTVVVLFGVLGMYWLTEAKKTRRVPLA